MKKRDKNILIAVLIIIALVLVFFLLNKKPTYAPDDASLVGEEETLQETEENDTPTAKTTANTSPVVNTNVEAVVETPEMSENVVEYNGKDFRPSIIIVQKGETVTFINKGDALMWVASDEHPTHRILPAFDQKKPSINGGMYSFTFTDTGSWTYHNHMNPSQTGKVIVKAN